MPESREKSEQKFGAPDKGEEESDCYNADLKVKVHKLILPMNVWNIQKENREEYEMPSF